MKVPVVLTRQEVEWLIAVPVQDSQTQDPHKKFNAIRNEALLRLLFSTGLRISEACNLNRDNIFFEEQCLKVREGKGGNEEYQPLTKQSTLDSLKKYLKAREQIEGKGQAFFISFYGHRLLPRQVNRYLKDYARRAGIGKNVHAHCFRHSFATEMYRRTGHLEWVQRALRHVSIQTTQIYAKVVKTDVEKALEVADL